MEVQQCIRIAQQFGQPVYVVSKGKNWGLGSRVPAEDRCVLMELGRMNRIIDYDEQLGYLTVEPGVTFRQATQYLRNKKSSLYLSVIGGHPDSSLVGNALERGDGVGPFGERIAHACAMQVVLPTGELVHTGFGRFSGSKVAKLSRWGVGPSLDGLFSQSNLGVVTQMTFWLAHKPKHFQSFLITARDLDRLHAIIKAAHELQVQGVIRSNCLALWNSHKMIASEQQYPWKMTAGRTPLSIEELKKIKSPWGRSEWVGVGGLYSASKKHADADRQIVKRAFRGKVDRLIFFNQTKSRLLKMISRPIKHLTGIDTDEISRTLYSESIFLGYPTERSTKSTYWRKKTTWPREMDPDRDRCGVIWLCPVVPFQGELIIRAIDIVTHSAAEFGFEPHIAFIFPSERTVYMFPSIVYDRDVPGQDQQAMACHDKIMTAMLAEGFHPYRLGTQSIKSIPSAKDGYDKLIQRIKTLIDPAGILSPGRYVSNGNPKTIQRCVSE